MREMSYRRKKKCHIGFTFMAHNQCVFDLCVCVPIAADIGDDVKHPAKMLLWQEGTDKHSQPTS